MVGLVRDIGHACRLGPEGLRMRQRGRTRRTTETSCTAIEGLFHEHHLGNIAVERATESPRQAPSGEYRRIIPLRITGTPRPRRHHRHGCPETATACKC
ncbi:hypothetical protein SAMN05421805_102307 [Saccharopolyspora antimicrobica]|uniref:Uncharacterized protein n=1 Tax=Saccharopolyspora antimicrobica TaxID=455193 RepID=A0A1I4VQ73_9PSEU|nr:hypothetical protein [Saccharopolyspora antimicrobica]RKT87277.1 hypothetical protein ATL45_5680 [Saccharopolyspora antimicrobica]SFN03106.1 hypothetical protein SAMN05421805_102307 [Saccharopolyspora antimicrobica]